MRERRTRLGSMEREAAYMLRALALARRGEGCVEPNPMVGCVLVRGGRIVGEGYHRRFGGPHAEVNALAACRDPRGATAYVTLEPCCHFGKTPPCTRALIEAGVARVVAATRDPNPVVDGGGMEELRRAGIQVELGLLEEQAKALISPFIKLTRRGRPWVILKWAQSLDGRIATESGDSKWITGEAARRHAHRTRGRVDAIVVGVGTVLADDPMLTCRHGRPRRVAARVVLDTHLRTPLNAKLVRTARKVPTTIFCGRRAGADKAAALERLGCRVERVAAQRGGTGVSLAAVLDRMGELRMTNVLVEGGAQTLDSFLEQRLADELHIYVAPILLGGRAPAPWTSGGFAKVADALSVPEERPVRLGQDRLYVSRTGW